MLLEQTHFRQPERSASRVIAVFSFRYDAQLVPALIENVRPLVHGIVSCDDRASTGTISDEPARRNALTAAARDMGADWILAVDPDERFEVAFTARIGEMTAERYSKTLWVFSLREMFSETAYRTDGIWGGKTQMRLFPAAATLQPLNQELHGRWIADSTGYRDLQSGLNLYHLRHISPARSQHRRDTYAAADPGRAFSALGYDYLADKRGATLREISAARRFHPPHVEDHELWATPKIAAIGKPVPDPPECRLRRIARSPHGGGSVGAAYLAKDALAADPEDEDMQAVAAALALQAGRPRIALALLAQGVPSLMTRVTQARALARTRDAKGARQAFAEAGALAGNSRIIPQIEQAELPHDVSLRSRHALWRRWCSEKAVLHEGPANGKGPLCVVIIGYKAPGTLAHVVAATCAQSDRTEIVVVNSGGGDVEGLLRDHLHRIRLIAVPQRLFVGHARNIGIDASRGRYVSFLADDCTPLPGWTEARIARHEAGALMVASAVVPERPDAVVGRVLDTFGFAKRAPVLSEDQVIFYGRSYHRTVFADVGYFAPGLRIGEDTEFHRRADVLGQTIWAPEIVVRHSDPKTLAGMLRDMQRRTQRFVFYLNRGSLSVRGEDWIAERVESLWARAREALEQASGIGIIARLRLRAVLALCVQAQRIGYVRADRILAAAEAMADQAKVMAASSPAEAAALLRKAVTIMPQDSKLHVALAKTFAAIGNPKMNSEAAASFSTALAIVPGNGTTLAAWTDLLLQDGKDQEALDACARAVIQTPNSFGILIRAASVARRVQRPALALFFAQSALASDVSNIRAHHLLERLHREAGRVGMARRRKQTALLLETKKTGA